MTVHEIFTELSMHMVKGLMVHEQLANYYDFLGLDGYRLEHEHQYEEESKSYRRLCHFYTSHFNRLVEEGQIETPSVIPSNWFRYSRFDVDTNTRKSGIENGFKIWKEWETDTIHKYERFSYELFKMEEISTAIFINEFIKDVEEELERIDKELLELRATSYDLVYVVEKQKELEEKYN